MKILITGAGGFLGRGMILPFEEHGYDLRLMDVVPFTSPHEVVIGDVTNYQQVEDAMRGVDGVVIAHMGPRGVDDINYKTPAMPFAINVTGTANLFHAALQCGVRRVVVISSTDVAEGHKDLSPLPHTLSYAASRGYYALTKVCQEVIAEQFARTENMQVACLRVGYILDGENNVNKYGKQIVTRNFMCTDRRDIGEVARLCLERESQKYEIFNVVSVKEALERTAVRYTCETLGWKPRYDFTWLKEKPPKV